MLNTDRRNTSYILPSRQDLSQQRSKTRQDQTLICLGRLHSGSPTAYVLYSVLSLHSIACHFCRHGMDPARMVVRLKTCSNGHWTDWLAMPSIAIGCAPNSVQHLSLGDGFNFPFDRRMYRYSYFCHTLEIW